MYRTLRGAALSLPEMQKTFASLLVTVAISVMGIPVAYLAGQRSAEYRLREEIKRAQVERQAIVAELRRDLAAEPSPEPVAAEPTATEAMAAPAVEIKPEDATTEAPVAPETIVAAVASEPAYDGTMPETADNLSTAATDTAGTIIPPAVPPASDAELAEESPVSPIARETFDAVAVGAAYADVARRFGREGLAALTMEDANGTQTRQYVWDWTGSSGEVCRVTMRFVDGRLTDKSWLE